MFRLDLRTMTQRTAPALLPDRNLANNSSTVMRISKPNSRTVMGMYGETWVRCLAS